jgi:hypothetical protein
VENDVGGFQIVVDDAIFLAVHVFKSVRDLLDDSSGLFFVQMLFFGEIL